MRAKAIEKQEHSGETLLREYYATKDPILKERAIKEFLPLVYYVVNRIPLPVTDVITRDDLEQSAIHGLLEAIERFDEDRYRKADTRAGDARALYRALVGYYAEAAG